ncbi:MAG: hypothetical protein ACD_45C00159G0005 [uncultured bacterium]|nr:MAG: hypothetical protein ACD_45C00159G0005 [uncultured bacterium]
MLTRTSTPEEKESKNRYIIHAQRKPSLALLNGRFFTPGAQIGSGADHIVRTLIPICSDSKETANVVISPRKDNNPNLSLEAVRRMVSNYNKYCELANKNHYKAILPVLDDSTVKTYRITMPKIPGKTFSELAEIEIPLYELIQISVEFAKELHLLHSNNMCHGDPNHNNILIHKDNQENYHCHLIDFADWDNKEAEAYAVHDRINFLDYLNEFFHINKKTECAPECIKKFIEHANIEYKRSFLSNNIIAPNLVEFIKLGADFLLKNQQNVSKSILPCRMNYLK